MSYIIKKYQLFTLWNIIRYNIYIKPSIFFIIIIFFYKKNSKKKERLNDKIIDLFIYRLKMLLAQLVSSLQIYRLYARQFRL